jgi:hypothetical protein
VYPGTGHRVWSGPPSPKNPGWADERGARKPNARFRQAVQQDPVFVDDARPVRAGGKSPLADRSLRVLSCHPRSPACHAAAATSGGYFSATSGAVWRCG